MNNRNFLLIMCVFLISMCSRDNVTGPEGVVYEKGAKLLEKRSYPQNSTTPYNIAGYEYNADDLLETVTNKDGQNSRVMNYEKYIYSNGELTKILLFENTGSDTYSLTDSIIFVYANNKLVEKTDYSYKKNRYTYEYSGSQLIEEKIYHDDKLFTTISYKYSKENLIDQMIYSPPYQSVKTIKYIYDGAVLTRKNYYNSKSELIRQIEYTCDRNENLIFEDPRDLVPLSGGELDKYYRYFYE